MDETGKISVQNIQIQDRDEYQPAVRITPAVGKPIVLTIPQAKSLAKTLVAMWENWE